MTTEIIRPIERSLLILRAMNQHRLSTISELCKETQLPKSTVHRLLATLIHCGYVEKDIERSVYMLTEQVIGLSDGYGQESRLVKAAIPIARQLTRDHKWPIAIGTFDYDAIVVQYSTRPYSEMTLRPSTVNKRFPLFRSALGEAYLGFCSEGNRKKIIEILRGDHFQADPIIQNDIKIARLVSQITKRGYGLREGRIGESSHIAVPIIRNSVVLGVIGISLFSSIYNTEVAVNYSTTLKKAAQEILDSLVEDSGQKLALQA